MFINDSNVLEADLSNVVGPKGNSDASPTTTNMLATVVCIDGSVQLYLNGVPTGSPLSMSPSIEQNNSNQIGSSLNSAGSVYPCYFTGTLSNFAIYDYALTAAQIQNHYNAGIS